MDTEWLVSEKSESINFRMSGEELQASWQGRALRFADGPDEVHTDQIARMEIGRYA